MSTLRRRRVFSSVVLVAAAAIGLSGCSKNLFDPAAGEGLFSKPMNMFDRPDWASPSSGTIARLENDNPVAPEDLIGADGRCATKEAPAPAPVADKPAAAPTGEPANGAPAGEEDALARAMHAPAGSAPMEPIQPQPIAARPDDRLEVGPATVPLVSGGIALGMAECDVARRAGMPTNVNVGASDRGDRLTVVTYLSGPWPGIYKFSSGRLKEIERAPEPPAPPPQPAKKKAKKPVKPKVAAKPAPRKPQSAVAAQPAPQAPQAPWPAAQPVAQSPAQAPWPAPR